MKRICSFLLLFLCVTFSTYAQKEAKQGVLTLGIARGVAPISYNAMYDYGLTKRFSLGLAVNYGQVRSIIPAPAGAFPAIIGYSNLYRTNVAGRALFHFGNSTNWDPYFGFRTGFSVWSGKGEYTYTLGPGLDLLDVKAGDVFPAVQVVSGVRYLFADWLGVNAELALGSPYIYSVGLNCKLTNTKAGTKLIKDAYLANSQLGDSIPHSLLQPVQKKNVIKISLGSILLLPGISYERYIANRFSFELGGTVNLGVAVASIVSEESIAGVFSETDSIQTGAKAYGMLKYYITAKNNAMPKGWYIGLSANYSTRTTRMRVTDLDSIPSPISFDYEKKQTQIAGGLVLGYQYTFKKHFCLDAFAGYSVGPTRLDHVKYYSADANEEKFISRFGYHLVPLNSPLSPAIFRVSVGYLF